MDARIEIKGDKRVNKKIREIAKKAPKVIDAILSKAAFRTQSIAVKSIQTSPATGRTYRRRSVSHTASAGGQPPRTDTGNLVRNITIQKESAMTYTVGSRKDAPYGFWLEFGTSKMSPRPWLTPAHKEAMRLLRQDLRSL